MEFLQANWVWLLLGLGVVWFLFRRGGMGCGMGGHESHETRSNRTERPSSRAAHNGHGDGEPDREESEAAPPRGRRGC